MSDPTLERIRRVFRLDPDVFDEVGADGAATGSALLVVFGAVALDSLGRGGLGGLLAGLSLGCLTWLVWMGSIHLLTVALGLGNDLSALFRALGFAAAPMALGLGAGLPLIGGLFCLAKWILTAAAFYFATRAVSKAEPAVSAGVCAAGLAVAWVVTSLVS